MDLYGLPPEEFTAARDAAAKTDRGLKALRKPSVSAWVINTLVREDPKLLDDLTALGGELLEAQLNGQGQELRALTEQRRQLVATVARHAIGLVDRDLSTTAEREVEATLEAALADPASAEAVRSGQLVRPLSYSGFGAVDLEGAVAPLPRVAKPAKPPAKKAAKKDTSSAEARALEAAGLLDDHVRRAAASARAAEDHERVVAAAAGAEDEATVARDEARDRLAGAEAALKEAHRARVAAEKEHEALVRKASGAARAVATAQDEADAARLALDKLRRG